MNKYYSKIKYLEDSRSMLNLGCGTRMHFAWNNLDFSFYALLSQHKFLVKILKLIRFLSEERYQKFAQIDPDIIHWDVRKGIPFNKNTFDVVYSSHLLEHLDKNVAKFFCQECYRILKPNGIIRIVVPDLHKIVMNYCQAFLKISKEKKEYSKEHEMAINELFGQMVRKETFATSNQKIIVQKIENFIRGNAQKAGEAHLWMYDKYSLKGLLNSAGFSEIEVFDTAKSRIKNWKEFNLDTDSNGKSFKTNSLYIEGIKK